MVLDVQRSAAFIAWLNGLRDARGAARIGRRIERLQHDGFGDHRSVGDGVSELRIDTGPGYRVYYLRHGATVVVLLAGGDKDSQARDIARAKLMAAEWVRSHAC